MLANSGIGSRRQCEELITSGRIEIDRRVASELGIRVQPHQEIRLDGETISRQKPVYLALFKPKGVLCTNQDQSGRRRAIDFVPPQFGRLFPVGRLDMQSEGLLILTNDGDFADVVTHPRYNVPKKYRIQVSGIVEKETLQKMKQGIYLADGFARVANATIKKHVKQSTILDIVLEEGMNREIRRVFAKFGHKVLTLIRISIGSIKLGDLLPGEYRLLTKKEIAEFSQ